MLSLARSAAMVSNVPPSAPQNRNNVALTAATPSNLPISICIGLTLVSSVSRILFDFSSMTPLSSMLATENTMLHSMNASAKAA
jgi:D-arabinose 5-phosphate isomerase GutQ